MHRGAICVLLQRFLEDFLGLGVAPISHVHVGLSDRVDFFGFHPGRRLARALDRDGGGRAAGRRSGWLAEGGGSRTAGGRGA